ncbi:12516_t:CDS:2, partial [Gigaspora margarita]
MVQSEYRDACQDLSNTEDKTSDISISYNQSEQESQDTSCKLVLSDNHESPATSVGSEQAFSIAGQMIMPSRNRLDKE